MDFSSFNRVVNIGQQITTQGEEFICIDGTSSFLEVPDSNDWNFAGEFCLEFFGVKITNVTVVAGLLGHYNASGSQRSISVSYDGGTPDALQFTFSTDGASNTVFEFPWAPTPGTPYDICVERDASNVVRMYIDGVMVASQTIAGTAHNSTATLRIGQSTSTANALAGAFKAVRITRAARYASDGGYTVPSLPLPTAGPP